MALHTGDVRYTKSGRKVVVKVQPDLIDASRSLCHLRFVNTGHERTMAEAEAEAELTEHPVPRKRKSGQGRASR